MTANTSKSNVWLQDLDLFRGPEHQGYSWENHRNDDLPGNNRPAVLMVHGFPGTPMETRTLGGHLHTHGWAVRAPLLPGFGSEISTLFERNYEEWVLEAQTALRELQRHHSPTLIIGHSMGGAIALIVAARLKPEGLVLLAPFWRLPFHSPWLRILSPILRLFIRRMRPFRTLNLNNSEIRTDIEEYLPDLDLDDPEVRQQIQNVTVPTRLFEQLESLGKEAYEAARLVTTPTLILQGLDDELVSRALTRKILARISGPVEYHELNAEHNLLVEDAPSWKRIKTHVRAFANRLVDSAERKAR